MDSLIKWDEPSGGTLYAHWELKTYTITLILYGNLKDSINVYYGDEIQATYAPARSHYEFVGYYSQPNGVGDCYVKGVLKYEYEIYHIIPESTGKKWYSHGNGTLYAHWKLFETDYSYQVSVDLADVATYGLFTYEEFAQIYDVPEGIFEAVGGENLKVSIGKGFIDYETLGVLIERYSEFFE